MNRLISIIVPIYNSEKYLPECLESIIKQTYKNLEIILVDDGSTDSSKYICDQYAEIDSRILVVHKINGGVSDARNLGLKIATGEYIGFIDSDDYIEPDMYENLLGLCVKNQIKLSCAGYDIIGKKTDSKSNSKNQEEFLSADKALRNIILGNNSILIVNAIWNRLYHKDIIKDVEFPKGKDYGEETVFNTQVILNAQKCIYTYKKLYHYRNRNGSIMHPNNVGIFNPKIISNLIPLQDEQIRMLYLNNKQRLASIACTKYYTDLRIFNLINTYEEYNGFIQEILSKWQPSFFEMIILPVNVKKKLVFILKAYFPSLFKNRYIKKIKNQ